MTWPILVSDLCWQLAGRRVALTLFQGHVKPFRQPPTQLTHFTLISRHRLFCVLSPRNLANYGYTVLLKFDSIFRRGWGLGHFRDIHSLFTLADSLPVSTNALATLSRRRQQNPPISIITQDQIRAHFARLTISPPIFH